VDVRRLREIKSPVEPRLGAHANYYCMPDKKTVERARQAKEEGKAPSTRAGEFVREEIEHIRQGKHGARSAKGYAMLRPRLS
jgi:hypothetical protein